MTYLEKQSKMVEALEFLNDHPAINGPYDNFLMSNLLYVKKCDKNGIWGGRKEEDIHTVYWSPENYAKFKKEFDEHYDADDKTPNELRTIYASYESIYGMPWTFDHVEFVVEVDLFVFKGKLGTNDWMDLKNFERYQGFEHSANTFEDAIIETAQLVKEKYGDFKTYESFITPEEAENHKKEDPFNLIPLNDGTGNSELVDNPKHIDVYIDKILIRWLKWFSATEEYKKYNGMLDGELKEA